MPGTALLELFLLVIAGLLGSIGWMGRKYLKQIIGRIDTALNRLDKQEERVEDTREDVREIKTAINGEKGTPWDGFIGETKKNTRKIQLNREKIQENRRAIKENRPGIEFTENGEKQYNDEWT